MSSWTETAERMDATQRSAARAACGVSANSVIVEIIGGDAPPCLTGESGGYFTESGDRIYHPSAYQQKAKSKFLAYTKDERKITVGRHWKKAE